MNLQSSLGMGTWSFQNVTDFVAKYGLELDAGTYFVTPYSPMVNSVLCQYHDCIGSFLSNFLAKAPSLPGITDLDVCGPDTNYLLDGKGDFSNGERTPLDWSQLFCKDCEATATGRKIGPGFTGINVNALNIAAKKRKNG